MILEQVFHQAVKHELILNDPIQVVNRPKRNLICYEFKFSRKIYKAENYSIIAEHNRAASESWVIIPKSRLNFNDGIKRTLSHDGEILKRHKQVK